MNVYFCAYPQRGPGFPTPYVVVFYVFNVLRIAAIVRFVDIDEIVDHHCLKLYFHNCVDWLKIISL